MSIIGILSSNLFSAGAAQKTHSTQDIPPNFEQIKTEFQQLGQDLHSGNLQGAKQDFANLQEDLTQISSKQVAGHHGPRHHGVENSQTSSSSFAPPTSAIDQAFNTLAQDLQTGNLSAAQSAFSTLSNDLQQIGGFPGAGSNGATSTAQSSSYRPLNVNVRV
jgi:hypothetical protein